MHSTLFYLHREKRAYWKGVKHMAIFAMVGILAFIVLSKVFSTKADITMTQDQVDALQTCQTLRAQEIELNTTAQNPDISGSDLAQPAQKKTQSQTVSKTSVVTGGMDTGHYAVPVAGDSSEYIQFTKDNTECKLLQGANGEVMRGANAHQAHECVVAEMEDIGAKISEGKGTPAMQSELAHAISLGYK